MIKTYNPFYGQDEQINQIKYYCISHFSWQKIKNKSIMKDDESCWKVAHFLCFVGAKPDNQY